MIRLGRWSGKQVIVRVLTDEGLQADGRGALSAGA
jgi:hypothetical protein